MENEMKMATINVERWSVVTSKPFESVVDELKAVIGHPDLSTFMKEMHGAETFALMETAIKKALGSSGFMQFAFFDPGAVLRKESGQKGPRIVRFVIGNPLIMKEMVKHVPDAASYAPVSVLIDERPDGVHLSYDRMAGYLAPWQNQAALAVARELDTKVESLLTSIAA
jgi:uncharacterized protein (DUF302 family)